MTTCQSVKFFVGKHTKAVTNHLLMQICISPPSADTIKRNLIFFSKLFSDLGGGGVVHFNVYNLIIICEHFQSPSLLPRKAIFCIFAIGLFPLTHSHTQQVQTNFLSPNPSRKISTCLIFHFVKVSYYKAFKCFLLECCRSNTNDVMLSNAGWFQHQQ